MAFQVKLFENSVTIVTKTHEIEPTNQLQA